MQAPFPPAQKGWSDRFFPYGPPPDPAARSAKAALRFYPRVPPSAVPLFPPLWLLYPEGPFYPVPHRRYLLFSPVVLCQAPAAGRGRYPYSHTLCNRAHLLFAGALFPSFPVQDTLQSPPLRLTCPYADASLAPYEL